jgi:hypothetical protein
LETQQTTEPTAAPSGNDGAGDLDSRAAALLEQISTDQKAQAREASDAPAAEKGAPTTVVAAKADENKPAVAALTTTEKTPEQVAEERRARIAARDADVKRLAEEERARVAASRQKKQERQPEPAPSAAKPGIEIKDAASFFAAAEQLQIPPQELAAWLTGQQDPTKAAKHAAREALSPVELKLKELEEKQQRWEEQQRQAAEKAQVAQLVERNHQLLATHLESVKSEAPLSAAFMAKNQRRFRHAVESICDRLPDGFTAQDVIDQLEEDLLDLQLAGSAPAPSAETSTTKPTAKPAAAKANVGNRLAAERATTVEDNGDDADDDLDTRARKLKARLAAG